MLKSLKDRAPRNAKIRRKEGKLALDYEEKKEKLSAQEEQKRCLKGLFPNINFDEKFCYKSRPSFITFTIYTLFYVLSLFAAESYHQLL